MNRWLGCIQIWYGCALGTCDDLINFGMNPLRTKWLLQPFKKKIDMVVVGVIFFSLFLDIDGQSLRLRDGYFFSNNIYR